MKLIFSADPHWGIGKGNNLLFRAPGDMKFFRRTTAGNVVVMGRKTLESLPGAKPLPDRHNVVMTRDSRFAPEGVAVCHSLEELFAHLRPFEDNAIMVIGGEQIYRMLMPFSSHALVTRWEQVGDADSFVPDFDSAPGWRLTEQSEPQEENGLVYRFCTYVQAAPTPWRE